MPQAPWTQDLRRFTLVWLGVNVGFLALVSILLVVSTRDNAILIVTLGVFVNVWLVAVWFAHRPERRARRRG